MRNKLPVVLNCKAENIPRDYTVLTRLKNGGVIAINDFFAIELEPEKDNRSCQKNLSAIFMT